MSTWKDLESKLNVVLIVIF